MSGKEEERKILPKWGTGAIEAVKKNEGGTNLHHYRILVAFWLKGRGKMGTSKKRKDREP